MAKYYDLKQKIKELENALSLREKELYHAHEMCDKLDVPQSKETKAWVGHRLYWYLEGKRGSYNTKDNTEGYSPEEWNKRKDKMKRLSNGENILQEDKK